jgi:hypothetical protein
VLGVHEHVERAGDEQGALDRVRRLARQEHALDVEAWRGGGRLRARGLVQKLIEARSVSGRRRV